MRKRSFLLVAGACLATLSLAVGTALAGPVPAQPPYRALQGTGSDTTQDVMNAYANGTSVISPAFPGVKDGSGNFVIASWDASPGSATITTKDPATFPQCSNIPRPNGSSDGINALAGLKAGFPKECVDFARSSTNDASTRTGQGLTYIPFAQDAVTYATFGQSSVPKNLPLATLKTIFQANTPNCTTFHPKVPQNLSGTWKFWNQKIGPFGNCVEQTTFEEHDGAIIGTDAKAIAPYGVGPWIAQTTNKTVTDRHGGAILRGINGQSPFNFASFPLSRLLFNVIPTSDIGVEPWASTFVGPNSQICQHPEVLSPFGIQPAPAANPCGSTTIQTP